MPDDQSPPPTGEIILYPTEDGRTRVECRFAGDTVWLTQALMARLFEVTVPTVNEHLSNLFEDQELDPGATIRKFRIVRIEGSREMALQFALIQNGAAHGLGWRLTQTPYKRRAFARRWFCEGRL